MFSEVDIVTGGSPASVAVRINEAIQNGYQLIGTIQGFSEPSGIAYFWATMGKPKAINERELGAMEERARVIGIIRSECGWRSVDLLEKLH